MTTTDRQAGFRLQGHAPRLQSLRGIAALCVAVGHAFTVMVPGRIEDAHFTLRPTNALLAAGEVLIQPNTAVILFYVLSGFVLGEALRRDDAVASPRHFAGFAIRRLFRLLPAMWVSIIFAAVVAVIFRHPPYAGATGWFNAQLTNTITAGGLVQNFLGLSYSINSVLWSVQIELAIIPFLPLAVWLSRRCPLWADIGVVAILCLITVELWAQAPNFVLFGYCFYLGVLLPRLMSLPSAARVLGDGRYLLVSLAVLIPVEYLYVSNRLWLVYKFLVDAGVCTHIIAFAMLRPDCRPARFLDRPGLVWLGDVSYSFYAFAMSVLMVCASVLLQAVPETWAGSDLGATATTAVAGLACVTISLALAQRSFARIEQPCTAMGRQWARRVERGGGSAVTSSGSSRAVGARANMPLIGEERSEQAAGLGAQHLVKTATFPLKE